MTELIREILRSIDADEASELDSQASFQESGALNSLQLLDLILAIEKEFELAIENAEVIPEHLDSIAGIARFVDNKRSAAARAQ